MSYTEARMKLDTLKDQVNPDAAGIIGGVYAGFTVVDIRAMEDAVVRYGLAEAILDGLATTEEGLAVRDILPDLDLLDKNGNAVGKRQWAQPWSGSYNNTETDVQVYQTGSVSKNDRKVLIIYGLKAAATGPGRTGSTLNATSVTWKRSNVKTIDIWQIEPLDTTIEGVVIARTPLLFKKSDVARVDMRPKSTASGANDNLIFLGKCVEPLGENLVG